jgi:hypothetical protein
MQRDKNEVTSFYVAITEITRRRASERQSRALFYGLTDSRSNTASQKSMGNVQKIQSGPNCAFNQALPAVQIHSL